MPAPQTPRLTVDVIVVENDRVLLIERKHPPHGWALPGGFVDIGEAPRDAAVREAKEETSLDVELVALLSAYGDPDRDARGHTVSLAYVARMKPPGQTPIAADDAAHLDWHRLDALPPLAFDHALILADYRRWAATGEHPPP